MKVKLEYTFDISPNDAEALAFYMRKEAVRRYDVLSYFTKLIEDEFIWITRGYAEMKRHFEEETARISNDDTT